MENINNTVFIYLRTYSVSNTNMRQYIALITKKKSLVNDGSDRGCEYNKV